MFILHAYRLPLQLIHPADYFFVLLTNQLEQVLDLVHIHGDRAHVLIEERQILDALLGIRIGLRCQLKLLLQIFFLVCVPRASVLSHRGMDMRIRILVVLAV
jgi:hypothetical protein